MPGPVVEAADSIVTFSNGIAARWSCLLFKTSGVPFFSRIGFIIGFSMETQIIEFGLGPHEII